MLIRSRLRSVCVAGLLAIGAASAVASPPNALSRDLDGLIRQRLAVTGYSMVDLVIPANYHQGFETNVVVGGMGYTLVLHPSQIVADGATMTLDYGNGNLVEAPVPDMGIFEGTVAGMPGGSVIAQYVGGRFSAMVLEDGAPLFHVQPLHDVQHGLQGHVAYRADAQITIPGVCGNTPVSITRDAAAKLVQSGQAHHTDGGLIAEVACEADYDFCLTHGLIGSNVAQDISRVMAWAGKYFNDAVGVRFRVTRYVIRLNPIGNYSDFEAGPLLDAFSTRWNTYFFQTQRDTAHLFTDKEIVGDTIGLARVSALCNENIAYGLSQTTFSPGLGRRASVTAHEIGHNFGASHCDEQASLCAPCGIMLAAQGAGPTQVMQFGCSSVAINTFLLGGANECLEPGRPLGGCAPDVNGDGVLNLADFGAFQVEFALGNVGVADFNLDGLLNLADFGAFQTAFAAGCP